MKKSLLKIIVFAVLINTTVFAEVSVYVNNDKLDIVTDVVCDRTFVPMRIIFESLGAEVEWFDESQSILATKESKLIALKIGINRLIVRDISNGETIVSEIDVAPMLKDGKTIVPLRAVSEALHASVEWIEDTQSIYISENHMK